MNWHWTMANPPSKSSYLPNFNLVCTMWDPYKKGFKAYLQLERSLSDNSVEAYLHDVEMLTQYLQSINHLKNPSELVLKDLQQFVKWVAELGMSAGSQASDADHIATKLLNCFTAPFQAGEHEFFTSASIGITWGT